MPEFKFHCPQCGRQIQCDTGYSRTQINCPACKQPITAPHIQGSAVPPNPGITRLRTSGNVFGITAGLIILAALVTACWFGYTKFKRGHMPSGLVALWSGEGNGGDTVGGNKMELTDISFAEGKVGQAFSFNGTSSTIRIPASPALDIGVGGGFTIMAWIKPADIAGLHPLFQWSDSPPLNLWIGIRPSEIGVLNACITDVDGNRFVVSHPGVLVSGVFQHIALTYDKASGVATWFLNGVIVAQRQLSGHVYGTKGDLWISHRDENPGNWSTGRTFAGLMDEIAIFNRALSASEIQTICTEQNYGEPLLLPAPSTGWYESWMR